MAGVGDSGMDTADGAVAARAESEGLTTVPVVGSLSVRRGEGAAL